MKSSPCADMPGFGQMMHIVFVYIVCGTFQTSNTDHEYNRLPAGSRVQMVASAKKDKLGIKAEAAVATLRREMMLDLSDFKIQKPNLSTAVFVAMTVYYHKRL